ncbi:PKD repeat protein [Methanolinea mesophila]|uniref:PKD domain-containing protein n=1 Tax=Methanolinea mesophila TaxID=547055 RepID=UPI001FD736AB|nr:PKD domain-containing protein [Methanolinea mesophila]MBP1928165.1 PKD repeat protein [Methanolinea mesophila]
MKLIENECVIAILCIFAAFLVAVPPMAAAGTTNVTILKYASDGMTVLNQTTVDFQWMQTNLPVYGDGYTHYYHQGPVMNDTIADKWNPSENDPVILTKDMGAVKGTDVKDLCNLAGGMSPGDYNVTLKAPDGFKKAFAYSSVYTPTARAGKIVLTWYKAGEGYVNGNYNAGMRNVMFSDTTTNPWHVNVFGLWDMHESYPEEFWYFYQPGLPSTTGLSVQNINQVLIFSDFPVASFSANTTSGYSPLTVSFSDESTGTGITSWQWGFGDGNTSGLQNPGHTYPSAGNYTVTLTVTNAQGSDPTTRVEYIEVLQGPVAFPGKTNLPTDPDGDGIYEDMNGNGFSDFNDVVLFFKQMEWVQANEPIVLFDFNHNGIIDFNDIVRLFKEI